MRTIIAGTRTADRTDTRAAIDSCPWRDQITVVLSGRARGADAYGEEWAQEHGIPIHAYPANWKLYGLKAGPLRNRVMCSNADALIAVWNGTSAGTRDVIQKALRRKVRVWLYRTDMRSGRELAPEGNGEGLSKP